MPNSLLSDQSYYEFVPQHLRPFLAKQDPSLYTPIDHASWRYILRVSRSFFSENAHQKYIDGLTETGISSERIPLISEMDACLQRFSWRAVPVVGFIPPAIFMEFLSLGMLPIACDMRAHEHIWYTPVPDIVHEAAGHAPIISDPEYATFLHDFGDIARKVIFSSKDVAVYNAIRELSDIKEDPRSTTAEINRAQMNLDYAVGAVDEVSEATELSRMGWWTFEYGLVGPMNNPKIYGAGLLSSAFEGYHCLGDGVKKIPFSIDCTKYSYDITKPQPQLFVTPDFPTLSKVLNELANTMSYKKGGIEGLNKAKRSATVTTAEFDSGIQVSGKLTEILTDSKNQVVYLKYSGPSQLSYNEKEISGHGASYHKEGFGTAIGFVRLPGLGPKATHLLTEDDLRSLGFLMNKKSRMEFTSGVVIEGVLRAKVLRPRIEGRGFRENLIFSFDDCKVELGGQVLFAPEWGRFDLACGSRVVSVFGEAADRGAYMKATGTDKPKPSIQKTNLTEKNRELCTLYQSVRDIREGKAAISDLRLLAREIYEDLRKSYSQDWLLRIELLELAKSDPTLDDLCSKIKQDLDLIGKHSGELAEVIKRGLLMI